MLRLSDRPSCSPDAHRLWPGALPGSRLSGRKNAHRGPTARARSASRPTRPQVLKGSRENAGCDTNARRTPLLLQGNQQEDLPTVTVSACHPPTFSEDMAQRSAASAALAGLGATDVSLSGAERLTEGMRAPRGVNLRAIGVLGKTVTGVGVFFSAYGAIYGETQEDRALGRQDVAFAALAEAWPASAPVVSIPYAAGRAFRDFREGLEAAGPSILDKAAQCP
jgi:hypothetical protein